MRYALQSGMDEATVAQLTGYDPWFVQRAGRRLLNLEGRAARLRASTACRPLAARGQAHGLQRCAAGASAGSATEGTTEAARCAREREAARASCRSITASIPAPPSSRPTRPTSTRPTRPRTRPRRPTGPRSIILGGGPNRIGQGIEFDYCCFHAAFALRDLGYETIMVNCNPETVSTDYDTADRLYFEPLTLEDVLNIVDEEAKAAPMAPSPVIVQFGGQTPLNLAHGLEAAGVPIWAPRRTRSTWPRTASALAPCCATRHRAARAMATATSIDEALAVAQRIGYPVLVRPCYVLGGRAMAIAYDDDALDAYMREAADVSPDQPVLIDRFLEDAFEVDVDAVCDGTDVVIGGIMQQIEEAGVHSGDSALVMPPPTSLAEHLETMRRYTRGAGLGAGRHRPDERPVRDKDDDRLCAGGQPARLAHGAVCLQGHRACRWADRAQVMAGKTLRELGMLEEPARGAASMSRRRCCRSQVPRRRSVLGPEMRSTGEAMGSGRDLRRGLRQGAARLRPYAAAGGLGLF